MPGDARRAIALVALLAASCGGTEADFYVRSLGVIVETDAPFTREPEFPSRVESTVDAALAYWGGDWTDMHGRTLTLSGAASVPCRGTDRALGCYDGDFRISTSDPGIGTLRCIEQTVLVHEIGHAVLGDRNHEDPRWMQLEPVRDALAGRAGYGADGGGECEIYVSVWRHPLGAP